MCVLDFSPRVCERIFSRSAKVIGVSKWILAFVRGRAWGAGLLVGVSPNDEDVTVVHVIDRSHFDVLVMVVCHGCYL